MIPIEYKKYFIYSTLVRLRIAYVTYIKINNTTHTLLKPDKNDGRKRKKKLHTNVADCDPF